MRFWDKLEIMVAIIGSVIGKSVQGKILFPSVINFTIQDKARRDTYQRYARTI